MNEFSPLPQAYKDKIQLDEVLADPEIKNRIESIDTYIFLAKGNRKNGDVDFANAGCQCAEKEFDEFRKKHPLFDNIQRQRDAYDEDLKKRATLTEDLTNLDKEIAQYKQKISELLKERKKTSKEIDRLDNKLDLEHPHTQYREKMVEYDEEDEVASLDEIKQWQEITTSLIHEGEIKYDEEGVEMLGLPFKMLNISAHDKLIRENFPGQYSQVFYKNLAGSRINLEVKKDAVDIFIHSNKSFGTGIEIRNEEEHLKKMYDWISEKYKTNDKKKQLYILQKINPDLFWRHWVKDTNGNYSRHLGLRHPVTIRTVYEIVNPDDLCVLFLIKNLTHTDMKKQ